MQATGRDQTEKEIFVVVGNSGCHDPAPTLACRPVHAQAPRVEHFSRTKDKPKLNTGSQFMTGGSFCPHCHERFAISGPSKAVAIASLTIAVGILALVGVRSIIGLVLGSALLWVPVSLFLNAAAARRKGVVLRKWKPRRRTFFEWLYERDSTPELFDKKPR